MSNGSSVAASRFDNHLTLIREVNAKKAFPLVRVYAMRPKPYMVDQAFLIVVTGPMTEMKKVRDVYYTKPAEAYVDRELKGDWNAINAESTNDNVPMARCRVDLDSFKRRLNEVVVGEFEVDRAL